MTLPIDYGEFLRGFGSSKFVELLSIQRAVLHEYSTKFSTERDVAAEMPTGTGKSLVALLIAEAWRREGKKVAILSANKTLAHQMKEQEADFLGVQTVLMEGRGSDIPPAYRRSYNRTQSIGIMNYWVYFNQNPAIDPADLLIMDDAHLAEPCLSSLYSVEFTRYDHENLFQSLVAELSTRFSEYLVLQEAMADSSVANTPPELLSFLDQVEIAARFKEIVDASPLLETDADLAFRWQRLRSSLSEANIYLDRDSIWVRPGVYPLESNSHYSSLTQCLYMSATIGVPNDLARQIGARAIQKISLAPQYSETTSGRRLILMNHADEDSIPVPFQAPLLAALRLSPKSLWLCASVSEARRYQAVVLEWLNNNELVGHSTWLLSALGNEIEQFRAASAGHLFVGGRFDGMSFHGDECRIVILSTLPRAINTQEEFFCAYLRDAAFMKRRLNARIIQALGRCNRASDDFAIYFLCDKRFDTHFGSESNRVGISRNIAAEIDMAQDLSVEDSNELVQRMEKFFSEDFSEYDSHLADLHSNVPTPGQAGTLSIPADREVLGWNALFESKNYTVASDAFEDCWDAAKSANIRELGGYYGWCTAKASFLAARLESRNPAESLDALQQAIDRGGRSAWFNRMRASLGRFRREAHEPGQMGDEYFNAVVRAFDTRLEKEGATGPKFERWGSQIESKISSDSHNGFAEAFLEVGSLLGFSCTRPRHSSATDVQWRGVFRQAREVFTFELKLEHLTSTKVSASDVGQAHIQVTRAENEYGKLGYSVRGFVVTHLDAIEPDAVSALGAIRIMPKASVVELWQRVRSLLTRYRQTWDADDLDRRRQAALDLQPRLPPEGWLTLAANADESRLSAAILSASWPST